MKTIKLLNLTFWLIILSATVWAQTDATATRRQAAFDKVWTTVYEKNYDPNFGGVDWRRVRAIYEPRAKAAISSADFHRVLQQMLDELGESHFAVITPNQRSAPSKKVEAEQPPNRPTATPTPNNIQPPPPKNEVQTTSPPMSGKSRADGDDDAQATATIDDFAPVRKGIIGVDLKIINNQVVITRVEPDSPAAKVGLQTGFVIEKINDAATADLIARLDLYLAARRETAMEKQFIVERSMASQLAGDPASKLRLTILDAQNQLRVVEIARATDTRDYSQPLGNLPALPIEFETKRLQNNIGYIRFNAWTIPQISKVRAALKSMTDAPGIVFDLRGNVGGLVVLAGSVAGNLVTAQTTLGTLKSRQSEQKLFAFPLPNAYVGKIVILTDNGSASTSEVFAAALQDAKRARVVGTTTMGAVLASLFDRLPTGALFQYAVSVYLSPNKTLIEARGVKPNVTVQLTRESLLAKRDLQLETAINEIIVH